MTIEFHHYNEDRFGFELDYSWMDKDGQFKSADYYFKTKREAIGILKKFYKVIKFRKSDCFAYNGEGLIFEVVPK